MLLNSLLNKLPQAAGNVIDGVATRAAEAATKVKGVLGGAGDFDRLADGAPALDETAAKQSFRRAELLAESAPGTVMDDIDEKIQAMSPSPWEGHDLDRLASTEEMLQQLQQDSVSASAVKAANAKTQLDEEHKVRLVEPGGAKVIFDVMPEVVESRTVEYEAIAPPQFPSAFQKYKSTSSTQWSVNATLTCRTTDEATKNLEILNILRGWTVPFFGSRTGAQYPQKLGAPPPVLTFTGWRAQMVGPVQVVITSLNWNFPQDVDYIPAREFMTKNTLPVEYDYTGKMVPFPTVIKIAIQLVESFSTDQMNGFSLADFRTGQMGRAFVSLPRSNQTLSTPPQQREAQTVTPEGAYRGMRSDYDPARRVYVGLGASVGGGRGVVNPPNVVPDDVVSEVKTVGAMTPKLPLAQKFVSGGGGDVGGAGGGGDF